MTTPTLPEVWLRGPLPDVPPLLQPVAHALLQAREEVMTQMEGFPQDLLWEQPAGVASPGFHLQHMTGVLDRLFTYAKGQSLSDDQLSVLAAEGYGNQDIKLADLLQRFSRQIDLSMRQLESTVDSELTQSRKVGRKKINSTVLGLYFHAAEHTMRHNGQLLVTVRFLLADKTGEATPR